MLEIRSGRVEDRQPESRRAFLRVGSLGLAGLTLESVLRQRARAADGSTVTRSTAVIQVVLGGGLTHLDSYDPKPDAPREYRGDFNAIATAVPGVSLCELLPGQARLMDRMAVIRSLHHDTSDHLAGTHWIMTGFPPADQVARSNERPSVGSVAAKLRGSNAPGLPPYVGVPTVPTFGQASYLGTGSNPFGIEGDPAQGAGVRNLLPPQGMTLDRIDNRRRLLARLDRLRRNRDTSGAMTGLDTFAAQAFEMVTGPTAGRAFDLEREDPRLRDRYGRTRFGQSCLLARRLVEAGVTFVTVSEGGWDHHGQVFASCRRQLPGLDAAVSTLVEDLHDRGLAEQVLVVVWGEFGRTPRINGNAGRDHWPGAFSAVLAGGGLRMGQVVGSTNSRGEQPTERALRPEDLIRTVYAVLRIDPLHEFASDSGRPMPVMNLGRPISELL